MNFDVNPIGWSSICLGLPIPSLVYFFELPRVFGGQIYNLCFSVNMVTWVFKLSGNIFVLHYCFPTGSRCAHLLSKCYFAILHVRLCGLELRRNGNSYTSILLILVFSKIGFWHSFIRISFFFFVGWYQ